MSAGCQPARRGRPILGGMNETSRFRVVPLPADLARAVRETRRDAAGHPVLEVRDGGRHQCRACLTLSREDEAVLLLSHTPFASVQPYAETGPVYIHSRPCAPEGAEGAWPAEFPRNLVVLRAYSPGDELVGAELVGERRVEDVARDVLARPEVAYLHARNADLGCYMFRMEPA